MHAVATFCPTTKRSIIFSRARPSTSFSPSGRRLTPTLGSVPTRILPFLWKARGCRWATPRRGSLRAPSTRSAVGYNPSPAYCTPMASPLTPSVLAGLNAFAICPWLGWDLGAYRPFSTYRLTPDCSERMTGDSSATCSQRCLTVWNGPLLERKRLSRNRSSDSPLPPGSPCWELSRDCYPRRADLSSESATGAEEKVPQSRRVRRP